MFVDSLTYLTNLISEKKKPTASPATMLKVRVVSDERSESQIVHVISLLTHLSQLEFFPPLVSVVALVSVSAYIIATATITLTDKHPHAGDEEGEEATNTVSVTATYPFKFYPSY